MVRKVVSPYSPALSRFSTAIAFSRLRTVASPIKVRVAIAARNSAIRSGNMMAPEAQTKISSTPSPLSSPPNAMNSSDRNRTSTNDALRARWKQLILARRETANMQTLRRMYTPSRAIAAAV